MRFRAIFHPLFAILALAMLASCGPEPLKKTSIHYSPPAVYPVRDKISDAQRHAAEQKAAADQANSAIDKARKLAPATIPDLQEALAEASGYINTVLTENDALKSALDDAQTKIDELEPKVAKQTKDLNQCTDDKNSAIDAVDTLTKENAIVEKRYHRLKGGVAGLGAAAAAYLIWKLGLFGLVRNLSFLGPWAFGAAIAGAVAIPGIVFAIIWGVL